MGFTRAELTNNIKMSNYESYCHDGKAIAYYIIGSDVPKVVCKECNV